MCVAHGTSVVKWTPRREKDLLGPLKTQPHKFKQPTYTIWILAQPKPSLLEVSPPESCARAQSVLKKPHLLEITVLERSRGPWKPLPAPQAVWRRVRSAVEVQHAAGADAAEEAALAGGARVTAGGRRRLAAVAGGHATGGRRDPRPRHLLQRNLFLWGNARAAQVAISRPVCPHLPANSGLSRAATRPPHPLPSTYSSHA